MRDLFCVLIFLGATWGGHSVVEANPMQMRVFHSTKGEDPYSGSVVLGLHMDGANGGSTFTDVKGKTITLTGSPTTSTAQVKYGTASGLFAKGHRLVLPTSADFTYNGDFTIETWVYPTVLQTAWGIFDARTNGGTAAMYCMGLVNVGGVYRLEYFNGTSYKATSTSVAINTWSHVAIVRSGSTLSFYVNGVKDSTTATIAATQTGGTSPVIGTKDDGLAGYGIVGYLDDFRITKGVARYTANFTPPSKAFP
ncbi:LamG domain-containing protein [Bdellovibrio sp. ArHS]|uniref:LamG domain-containing protein n=1 Tax=Bdellovibrio sp. ArHS TaxID=1569284 RepID=UPI0025BE0BA1|nr:LamG domain-containing protein [Bdellovibrio sp. ArHS]